MAPAAVGRAHLLLRVGSMLAVFVGATAIAARTDEPTLAAHQIAASMLAFLALALDALAIPAQTLVAEQLGPGTARRPPTPAHRVGPPDDLVRWRGRRRRAGRAPRCSPALFTADGAVVSRATGAFVVAGA